MSPLTSLNVSERYTWRWARLGQLKMARRRASGLPRLSTQRQAQITVRRCKLTVGQPLSPSFAATQRREAFVRLTDRRFAWAARRAAGMLETAESMMQLTSLSGRVRSAVVRGAWGVIPSAPFQCFSFPSGRAVRCTARNARVSRDAGTHTHRKTHGVPRGSASLPGEGAARDLLGNGKHSWTQQSRQRRFAALRMPP